MPRCARRARAISKTILPVCSACATRPRSSPRGNILTLRDAERVLRDIRTALDAPGPLPSRQDQQTVVSRLKAVQS